MTVATPVDRSIAVPAGQTVSTGYVPVDQVTLACRDRMAIGDVDVAFRRLLSLGSRSSWPPPRGHWNEERFVLEDGRHEYVAALMLGRTHIFVAWLAGTESEPGTNLGAN